MSLTLSPTFDHLWELQLLAQRSLRNLSATHVTVGTVLCRLLAAGEDTPTHGELAALCRCSVSTVQLALHRLAAVGMLGWEQRWDLLPDGRRRQQANRYWLRLPEAEPVARPDLRRRRAGGIHRPRDSSVYQLPAWQARAELAAIAARRTKELLLDKKTPARGGAPASSSRFMQRNW